MAHNYTDHNYIGAVDRVWPHQWQHRQPDVPLHQLADIQAAGPHALLFAI